VSGPGDPEERSSRFLDKVPGERSEALALSRGLFHVGANNLAPQIQWRVPEIP
jgi:hypothetical protein